MREREKERERERKKERKRERERTNRRSCPASKKRPLGYCEVAANTGHVKSAMTRITK